MEAAKASLMAVGQLTAEQVEERLMEARRTYKLNLGYAGISALPAGFVDMVKKFNPHITELELSSNKLSELPDDLEELQFLRTVGLKYNQLKRMPAVLSRLPQLMVLEMSGNQISQVPETIGTMSMLKELNVGGNMITKVSDALCHLPKLEVLLLDNNRLEMLPEDIGELSSLVKLDFSNNTIRFLPVSMGFFKKIQRIDCSNNMLAKVPPSMGHLKLLKEFNLRYNSLDDRYNSKVEEGLSRLLAFLREEEERERLEEIERLKPIGTPVGSYLEYRCKAEPSHVVKTEAGEVTLDNRCWLRHGHSLTQVGSMLVVFGGTTVKDGATTNDVYWMTIDRMEWHLQPTKGERPSPRYNHAAVFDSDNNRLIIFGGRAADRKRLNDVWFLDLETWTWHRPATDGTPPTPRELAVSAFWAGNMVIFGGHAIGGRSNDLLLLDLQSWQWSHPATSGTAPSPRQASAICVGHGNLLFIHGGRNNFVLEDLHVLDFMNMSWTEISASGRMPPPRHSHLLAMTNGNLYLFGGLDELGAQSTAMYRIALPSGVNYSTLKPEWVEWESELPYNKSRSCTIFNGSLSCYQLGSNTLGRVNDEEYEKGLVFFDVFKNVKLNTLKAKELDEEELKPKNAKRLRVQHTINMAAKMPRSFTSYSAAEEKVVAYVQDFQRTFEELYPYRRSLYLMPKNECGVHKFVCTTIRPTQLNYTELYDLDGCASFVSDFMAYESLEDHLHPPEFLPSPMSALGWQAGDCFDCATVLTSLLIGAGYDAYVVVGYAQSAVCDNVQTDTMCPVLEREAKRAALGMRNLEDAVAGLGRRNGSTRAASASVGGGAASAAGAAAAATAVGQRGKYQIKKTAQLESKFLKRKEAEELAAATASVDLDKATDQSADAQPADAEVADAPAAAPQEPGLCRRVHAWVLVKAGSREVTEDLFIEPTTARRYLLSSSPYKGVEYLFNSSNFWVCMQMPLPHSDSRALPSLVNFDLSDASAWEAVFEGRGYASAVDPTRPTSGTRGESRGESRGGGMTGFRSVATPKGGPPKTPLSAKSGATASKRAMTGASDAGTPPRTAESLAGPLDGGLGATEPEDGSLAPHKPPSWVPKLSVPRDAFDMRCPRGSKLTLYQRAQHEIYARFGDCSRWDGMSERLVVFDDEARSEVAEVRELFQRRRDRLRERRVFPKTDTTIEYFDAGSSFGLRDILTVRNDRRIINFYPNARLDGLLCRVEYQGQKIIERFEDRDDKLVYRSATYVQEVTDGDDANAGPGARRLGGADSKRLLPIRKMTEKYARNKEKDADEDVAKMVFYLTEGRIRLEYHFGEDRITNSSRMYHKSGQSQIVQVDPLVSRPNDGSLLEEYQKLLLHEKECMQAIRDIEWEVSEIIRTRTNQEQNITLESPYYDIVRIKAEASDDEEEEEEEQVYDYLSPFLPPLVGMQKLTRDQALDVREKCLRALKDRLIERASIIQSRLDEDTASLAKRQAAFNRDRDQMSNEEEEEYQKAVEESMFRYKCLQRISMEPGTTPSFNA